MISILSDTKIDLLNSELSKLRINPVLRLDQAPEEKRDEYELLSSMATNCLTEHEAQRPLSKEVAICLIEDNQLHARAIRLSGFYVVALNGGLFEKLYYRYSGFIGQAEIRECLGIPSDGRIQPQRTFSSTSELFNSFANDYLAQVDGEVASMTSVMSRIAVWFLCFHEYAHIITGHLDLMMPKGSGIFLIIERPERESDEDRALSLRALEYDADSFAALQTARKVFQGVTMAQPPNNQLSALHMRVIFLAIMMLFLFLESSASLVIPDLKRTHPKPARRAMFGLGGFMDEISRTFGKTSSEISAEILVPCLQAIAKSLVRRVEKTDFLTDAIGYYGSDELQQTLRRWAKLKPELEKLKLAPDFILAPVQAEPG